MHSLKPPRARRWTPFLLATVMSAVFAGPAFGQAVVDVTYNTSDVLLAEMDNAKTVTVTRAGNEIATATPAGLPGEIGVNSAHIPGDTGCWTTFTPQILPGDVLAVDGANSITIPDMTAETPTLEGDTVVVRGHATGIDQSLLSVQLHPANGGRFTNGSSGGQFLDSLNPLGFNATTTFNGNSFTTRFSGLGAELALAANSAAVVSFDPAALAAVDPAIALVVNYEAGAVPGGGGASGCAEPFAPNEAKSVNKALVNSQATDLVVSGVSQPGASASTVTLIDSAGKTISAPASGGATWTATVPAAQVASLADGPIQVGSTYSIGKGATVNGLLTKDATAPAAPTSSLAAGSYIGTQSVSLKAAEGTIRYTTDGSDPTASSAAYSKALSVPSSQTIKAVAIDAAGNTSNVASFGYSIGAPAVAPAPRPVVAPVAPKLKLDALTLNSRYSLKTVRKRGFSMVVFAPEGAKVVKVRLLRNGKVITRVTRKVSKDGVITITLPTSKKGRRALKRGTYKSRPPPAQTPKHFAPPPPRPVPIREQPGLCEPCRDPNPSGTPHQHRKFEGRRPPESASPASLCCTNS